MHKWLAILVVVAAVAAAFARDRETIEQLKARAESASPKDRVDLALRVAEHQVAEAKTLYETGKPDEARAAIQDAAAYTEKAADAATESSRKLKQAEITVRKLVHKLGDLKRTVNFEDQPAIQDAIDRLERVRTNLLNKMFDLGKGQK
jgi:hypothetical protein